LNVSCSDFKIPQLEELKKAIPDTDFNKIEKIILTNRIDSEIQNQKINERLDEMSKDAQSLRKDA
jgi:hypothetical protein